MKIMDISAIRKANLLFLIKTKASGSQKDFAHTVGTSPAYLSQIINGTTAKNGKPAAVGTPLARKIEKSLNLQHGYMDISHENPLSQNSTFEVNVEYLSNIQTGEYLVPILSWEQAASFVSIKELGKSVDLSKFAKLPPNVKSGKNGFALEVTGDSMCPKFLPGDYIYVNPDITGGELVSGNSVVIVDINKQEVSLRVLDVNGNCKYLQLLKEDYPNRIIELDDHVKVIGKVVGLYRDV